MSLLGLDLNWLELDPECNCAGGFVCLRRDHAIVHLADTLGHKETNDIELSSIQLGSVSLKTSDVCVVCQIWNSNAFVRHLDHQLLVFLVVAAIKLNLETRRNFERCDHQVDDQRLKSTHITIKQRYLCCYTWGAKFWQKFCHRLCFLLHCLAIQNRENDSLSNDLSHRIENCTCVLANFSYVERFVDQIKGAKAHLAEKNQVRNGAV